jgi:hypothetical protein
MYDNMMHMHCMLIPKAKNTYSEYITLIVFTLQLWLHGCTSILPYMYNACLAITVSHDGSNANFQKVECF